MNALLQGLPDHLGKAWPATPAMDRVFVLDGNALTDAMKVQAIAAYPEAEKLKVGGLAHQFFKAQLAYMFFAARVLAKVERVPSWAVQKRQQSKNRLSRGALRLRQNITAYRVIIDALMRRSEVDFYRREKLPGLSIRFSEDFREAAVRIPLAQPNTAAAPVVDLPNPSLRATILHHRSAFGRHAGDDEDAIYRNILSRYVKRMGPTIHIVAEMYAAHLALQQRAQAANLELWQHLIFWPDWVTGIVERSEHNLPLANTILRSAGLCACDSRMLHLRYAGVG